MDILLKCEMIIASLGDFKTRNSGQTMRIIQKTPKTPMTGEVVGEEAARRRPWKYISRGITIKI